MSSDPAAAERLRIAYFGLPLGAVCLARAGHCPALIVLGHPQEKGARRVRRQLSRHALVLGRPDLDDTGIQKAIESVRPDVLVSWFWPKLLPAWVLSLAPRGAFGVHPSLLPRWRGPDPYFWAVYGGDAESGVTLHRLAAEYDTGAVIASRKLAIAARDTAWSLAKRLDRPSLALLVDCVRRLARGEALPGEPQDESQVTEAPAPDEELLELDWERPAAELERLVRAASPYPGAMTELGDTPVDVLAAEVYAGKLPRALLPGDAALVAEGVVVRAGDLGLLLREVRTEAGELLAGREIGRLFVDGLTDLAALPKGTR